MPGQNLLGPYGPGVNETYDTPDFGDSGGTAFSWFVDCTDDLTPDGTRFTARWANRVMLVLRQAVVGMGIPLNETNGNSLLDAIMRAHRPIVNIGGGIGIHKGEKMPEWQHELRTLEGAGTVSVSIVGDKIVITGGAGSSVTLQSLGTGLPVYKGISGSVHQFRSIMAEAGVAVVESANHATFRLAPIPGWSLLMRNGASADVPAGVAVDELTEQVTPSLNDWLMLQRNPGRELRKVKVGNLPRASKSLVALVTVTNGNTFTPIFGCSLASPSGLGTRFALDVALSSPCVVVPLISFATSVHVGDGASHQAAIVHAATATHFNVSANDNDGNTQTVGAFLVFG